MSSVATSSRSLWDSMWTLARTDFKTRYQPTLGGFIWALMKPVAMFLVLIAVFSFIFGGDPTYRFNLIIGLFLWDFFAEGTKTGLMALQVKGYLLNKALFPAVDSRRRLGVECAHYPGGLLCGHRALAYHCRTGTERGQRDVTCRGTYCITWFSSSAFHSPAASCSRATGI